MEKLKIKKIKKIRCGLKIKLILGIILGFVILVVLFLGIVGWGIYKLDWRNDFIAKVTQIVPFPAAKVGNNFILYSDYLTTLNSAIKFYEKQDPTLIKNEDNLKEIKKMALDDRLIKNLLVKKIAQRYNVTVSQEEVQAKLSEIILNKGSQAELEKFLADYYNFSSADYKKYFIEPNLYYDKTNQAVADDDKLNGAARKKVEEFLSKLKSGGNFEELAKVYSEDDKAKEGGFVSEFHRGQLPKTIEDQLFGMQEGEYTGLLVMADRFQVFKLEKKDLDKGLLTLRTISVRMTNLDDLLKEERAKTKIQIFVYQQ